MSLFFPGLYLVTLFIAPQIWYGPLVNFRTDLVLYPLWFLYVLFSGKIRHFRFGPQEGFLVLLLIWILLSLLANGVPISYKDQVFQYIKHLLLFLLISMSLSDGKQVRYFIILLVFLSFILSIEGIQHYYAENELGWAGQALGWVESGEKGRTRWVGIFDGPGVFCVVYTIALPFVLLLIKENLGLFSKIVGIGLSGVFFPAIFFNGSRGGFLTTLAIGGMVFGMDYIKKYRIKLILPLSALLIVLMLAPGRYTQLSDSHKSSANRVDMWAEGVEMVTQNPVFGIGKGRFQSYTGKLIAHNSAIEIMGETGAVGLFAWIGLIYFSLANLYHFILQVPEDERGIKTDGKILAKGLFIAIVGYLISAMFVSLEFETFYMLLGLCTIFDRQVKQRLKINPTHIRNIILITLTWLIVIKIFTVLFQPGDFSL